MTPRRTRSALLLVAVMFALAPACYFGAAPNVPYPAPEVAWQVVPPSPPLGPSAGARGARLIVVSRFRSTVANPIGGLYDHTVRNLSPLWRTYFARHPELAIMEGFAARLREAGVRALKDYTDPGNPALVEAPLRARSPLLLATTITRLRHDQVRQAEPLGDFEALVLTARFSLREVDGREVATLTREVVLKLPAGAMNLLQAGGAVLADGLLADAPARAAMNLEVAPAARASAAPAAPAGGVR